MKKAVVVTALLLLTAGFAFAGEEFHVDLEVDAAYALVSGVYVVPSLAFTYQGQFGGMFFTMDPTQFYFLHDGYVATTGFNLNVDFVPRATPLDESQLEGYDPVSSHANHDCGQYFAECARYHWRTSESREQMPPGTVVLH